MYNQLLRQNFLSDISSDLSDWGSYYKLKGLADEFIPTPLLVIKNARIREETRQTQLRDDFSGGIQLKKSDNFQLS